MKYTLPGFEFLNAAQNRGSFFRLISEFYPSLDPRYKKIEKAYNDAKDAFRGISRDDGDRYFEHIRAVVLILIVYLRVTDYRLIIAAILHDIVEDIPSWTIERVRREYGEYIAMLVQYLSKPSAKEFGSEEECERIYHGRFRFAPREFFLLKLSDRLHNTFTLGGCTKEKRRRKIVETYRYYIPYAEKYMILYHELMATLRDVESL